MVLRQWSRSKSDLLAPFDKDGQFQGLIVQHYETTDHQDTAWSNYERDGDREVLAYKRAAFFRCAFALSLACALTAAHDRERVRSFSERLEEGLKLRLSGRPAPINSLVGIIVLQMEMRGRLVSTWTIE
jgi:hypothetical protein